MGSLDVNSFRNAVQNQNFDDLLTFDANKGEIGVRQGSGQVFRDYDVALSAGDRQRNSEIRGLLLNALARDVGVEGMKDPAMKNFFDTIVKRLLGDGSVDEDSVCFKPLTARDVKSLIDDVADMKVLTTFSRFDKANPELFTMTGDAMKELKALQNGPSADKAKAVLADFEHEIDDVRASIENGGALGAPEIKSAHVKFVAAVGALRIEGQIQENEAAFKEIATTLESNMSALAEGDEKNGPFAMKLGVLLHAEILDDAKLFNTTMKGLAAQKKPDGPTLEQLAKDPGPAFQAALLKLQGKADHLFAEAMAALAKGLCGAMDARADVLAKLDDAAGELLAKAESPKIADGGGDKIKNWIAGTLRPRLAAIKDESLPKNGVASPESLKAANARCEAMLKQLRELCDSIDASSGTVLAATIADELQKIDLPECRVQNTDEFEADRKLMNDALDVEMGAELLDSKSPSAQAVKPQLAAFADELGKRFKEVQSQGDLAATRAFDGVVRTAFANVEKAVAAAVKAGVDLEGGVAAILSGALKEVAAARPAAENRLDGPDPFTGVASGAFATLDALNAATARETKFAALFGGALDRLDAEVGHRLEDAFGTHENAKNYFVRVDGNVTGFTVEGQEIFDDVLADVKASVRERLHAIADETDGARPLSFEKALSLVSQTLDERIAAKLNERLQPAHEEPEAKVEASLYPRGTGAFGLDVGKLTKGELEGLKNLMRAVLTDTPSKAITTFTEKREDVEAEVAADYPDLKGDAFNEKVDAKLAENKAHNEKVAAELEKRLAQRRFPASDCVTGSAQLERALWQGKIKLEGLTLSQARCLMSFVEIYMLNDGLEVGEHEHALGTRDVGEVIARLGELGVTLKDLETISPYTKDKLVRLAGLLYAANFNSTSGADALCERLFGGTVLETLSKLAANDKTATAQLSYCENKASDGDKYWRSVLDPFMKARVDKSLKLDEPKALAFLRRQYALVPGDKDDVVRFRAALAELKGKDSVQTTFAGTPVTLAKGPGGKLRVTVELYKGEIVVPENEPAHVAYEDERVSYPVHVGVDLDTFISQLDDAIVSDVETYGAEKALAVLESDLAREGGDASSVTRQHAINAIVSFAHMRTADLCLAPTEKLAEIARALLQGVEGVGDSPETRAAYVKNALAASDVGKIKLLNSEGTLELYGKMIAARERNPQSVQDKVYVPEPPRVRPGETPKAARLRQIHEFASDLIQLHDSTKFDLCRKNGMTDAEIMRGVLLAHPYELKELLAKPKLLETLALPGAHGMKLTGFQDAVRSLIDAVRKEYDAGGCNFEALLGRIKDGELDNLFADARASIASASKAVLSNMQATFSAKFVAAFEKSMNDAGMTEIWKKTLDELGYSGSINADVGYGLFLKQVIGDYFTSMDDVDRDRMASQLMRFANSESTMGEALGALLKGAGPILQKLMQGLPQSALPEDLAQAVNDLKSNLAPIPEEAVRAHLLDMVAESGGRIKKISVQKSLGAASVGQAFLCTIQLADGSSEECVVKILRPDAQGRASREEAFFQRACAKAGMGEMLSDRFARIFDELDLMVEAGNVAQGSVYDPGSELFAMPGVASMKLDAHVKSTMNTMVLKRAPGTTYDRYVQDVRSRKNGVLAGVKTSVSQDGTTTYVASSPLRYYAVRSQLDRLHAEVKERQQKLIAFSTKWVEEAVFKGGFFHGDLHAGNVMTDASTLTVIDYGNASRLTEGQRKELVFMMAQLTAKSPGKFLDHLVQLMSEGGKTQVAGNRAALEDELGQIFAKGTAEDAGKMFVAAFQHLQNKGVEIPGFLFSMMQCMQRLDESVNALNRELAEIRLVRDSVELGVPAENEPDETSWIEKDVLASMKGPNGTLNVDVGNIGFVNGVIGNLENFKALLLQGCTSPEELEKLVKDIRVLAHGGPYNYVDSANDFENMMLPAKENPAFFQPGEPGETLRNTFAGDAANLIKQMASGMFAASRAIVAGVNGAPDETFADAFNNAVCANKAIVRSTVLKNPLEAGKLLASMTKEEMAGKKAAGFLQQANDAIAAFKEERHGGLFGREIEIAGDLGKKFQAPTTFEKLLKKSWATNAADRQPVLDVLAFNLAKFKEGMRAANLGPRMNDPATFKSQLETYALGVCGVNRPLAEAVQGMKEKHFNALLDAVDDDMKAFLQALRDADDFS